MDVSERHKRNIIKAYAMVWRFLFVERQQIQIGQNSAHPLLAWWNVVDWSPIVRVREGVVRPNEKAYLKRSMWGSGSCTS